MNITTNSKILSAQVSWGHKKNFSKNDEQNLGIMKVHYRTIKLSQSLTSCLFLAMGKSGYS